MHDPEIGEPSGDGERDAGSPELVNNELVQDLAILSLDIEGTKR